MAGVEIKLHYDPGLLTDLAVESLIPARRINRTDGGVTPLQTLLQQVRRSAVAECLIDSSDVGGTLTLVFACRAGYSGAPLSLWTITFQAAKVTEPKATELNVEVVELVDAQIPPQVLPGVGGTATVTIVPGVCGDLNDNGVVTVIDGVYALQIIVELLTATPEQSLLGDVSGPLGVPDGKITVDDVVAILEHLVGKSEITGCGPQIQ